MPLTLASTEDTKPSEHAPRTLSVSPRLQRQRATRARMERRWLQEGTNWDPEAIATEKLRIERTTEAIKSSVDDTLEGKTIADLGCGGGTLTHKLASHGAHIHACDIATNALAIAKRIVNDKIELSMQCLPDTSLPSKHYDAVVCADVIAEIDSKDYRLLMSEFARLVKPEGIVVVSTAIDRSTEGAVVRLLGLLGTEFTNTAITTSHHALLNGIERLLRRPSHLLKVSRSPLKHLWRVLAPSLERAANALCGNITLVRTLERITPFICRSDHGITHVIVCTQRKPLT